eukprot:UN04703
MNCQERPPLQPRHVVLPQDQVHLEQLNRPPRLHHPDVILPFFVLFLFLLILFLVFVFDFKFC